MKTSLASLLLPLAVLLSTAPAVFADGEETAPADAGFKPKEYPLGRYAHLDKKSPFEFDPPPPTPPETVNSFEGVSLGGYCGSGNTLTVYLIEGKEKVEPGKAKKRGPGIKLNSRAHAIWMGQMLGKKK